MRDIEPQIEQAGAGLAVVGSGKPRHARAFKEERQLSFPLFVDPEMNAYRAAGLRRGLWQTLGLKAVLKGLPAIFRGFRQGRTQGDPWQQGGVFVILPDSKVKFSHINRHAADHAPLDRVVAALRSA